MFQLQMGLKWPFPPCLCWSVFSKWLPQVAGYLGGAPFQDIDKKTGNRAWREVNGHETLNPLVHIEKVVQCPWALCVTAAAQQT